MFITHSGTPFDDTAAFERALYNLRRRAEREMSAQRVPFYACSLSSRVIVYKGQLTPGQMDVYYPDLSAPDFCTHLAVRREPHDPIKTFKLI